RSCSCTAFRQSPTPNSPEPKALNPTTNDPPTPSADHRELATQQGLFITSPYSPGSPLFGPNGAYIFNQLQTFLRTQYPTFGFREVITPTIYKKSLWLKSGHWQNYAADMFAVKGGDASDKPGAKDVEKLEEDFGLKPMNCPGHCLLFAAEKRSYRDLPVRFADFSALHRNEISGALSGLTRVRRFHQDDGHIFCRPIQIQSEIKRSLDFVGMVYDTFKLGPYKLVLSTRPKNDYIGTTEEWDRAEKQLKNALVDSGREWTINEGDGAFYGPKIDIILKDSDGKEHQTATIQLDFQLPQRFDLKYTSPEAALERQGLDIDAETANKTGKAGTVTPVLIHRAILGSLERFMALLIEHYRGEYPFWLNPRPCIVLTLNDEPSLVEYATAVANTLSRGEGSSESGASSMGRPPLPVDVDASPRSLGKKIHQAGQRGYAFIAVVGPKEAQ
ncbi:class II aaRS and biotin synthetase, partial [Saccharata proteae CBS 121410]